ncbi:uncharacterized protein LOC124352944 [Homalodisca vitripennis]|uniref:uncharacterized protein LOC124352944 n=1 Tax=Homalodisca vitripennis TaxID=197043 RepID=UPI001EEB575C|nr:uncharacterized protein LOC124352944 [Homalodisca vitripennis]
MSEYRQQTSRDSDDLEETFVYSGTEPPRPQPRAYRPRSSTSDTIPFADAEVVAPQGRFSNGNTKEDSLERRRVLKYLIPPPPPPPPPTSVPPPPRNNTSTTLESEDSTSLNNILDALDDLEQPDDSDEDLLSSMATTGSIDDSEDDLDVLTDLPVSVGKWSAIKSEVSMRDVRADNGVARVLPITPENLREQPSGHEDVRSERSTPTSTSQLKLQVGCQLFCFTGLTFNYSFQRV